MKFFEVVSFLSFLGNVLSDKTCVVDAGSTGSRLRCYDYLLDAITSSVSISTLFDQEVTPGLQNVQEADIPTYVTRLYNGADLYQDVTQYWASTAGMRTMDPQKQARYYDSVTGTLNTLGFNHVTAETISGEQEGLYDSYSIHYLASDHVYNVCDLGGQSLECVYATDAVYGKTLYAVDSMISNQTETLASQTYLTGGQDATRFVFSDYEQCFPKNYPMPDDGVNKGGCLENVQDYLVGQILDVNLDVLPEKNQTYYLISGFYYAYAALVYNNTNVPASFPFDINELRRGYTRYCNTDWNIIAQNKDDYANTYCFNGQYIDALFTALFSDVSDSQFIVAKKLGNPLQSVSWALGYIYAVATNTTSTRLPEPPPTSMPTISPTKEPSSNSDAGFSHVLLNIFVSLGVAIVSGTIGLALGARNPEKVSSVFKACGCGFFFPVRARTDYMLLDEESSCMSMTSNT
ncbi:MAG: hypothetical protein LRY67_04725 [Gammaproteobacteria bacterium]|nr:hypothetical protein [Gammaproteobacteria bacterium]